MSMDRTFAEVFGPTEVCEHGIPENEFCRDYKLGVADVLLGQQCLEEQSKCYYAGWEFGYQAAGVAVAKDLDFRSLEILYKDLEAEAERRRQAIAHLLRWKSESLKYLTDGEVLEIVDSPSRLSKAIREFSATWDEFVSRHGTGLEAWNADGNR